MIESLFHAHSGLRFLVLLAALGALLVQLLGVLGRRPYGRSARVAMLLFTGLLDLQILLGIALVAMGCFFGALMGHLMMMLLAAAAVHGCSVFARKQADPARAHTVALVGVVLALALMVGGIAAIGRSPVARTASTTCTAGHRAGGGAG